MAEPGAVVRTAAAQALMREHFLGWQCRIRQLAVRQAGGRPTSGMRPRAWVGPRDLGPIVVLIHKAEPTAATAEFRHMVRRTHDPAERYEAALRFLAAGHYQRPAEFDDELTALFGPASPTAERLLAAGACRLVFEQYAQRFDLSCRVRELAEDAPGFQATYWHNALFNPALPAGVRVLALRPDWNRAEAEPPLT